jgi:hypothetical protein
MVDQVRKLLQERPFEPFTIVVSSGQRHFVASPEHASVLPKGSRVFVAFDDDTAVVVSVLHITALEAGMSAEALSN